MLDFTRKLDIATRTVDELARELKNLKDDDLGKDYIVAIEKEPYIFMIKSDKRENCYLQFLKWLEIERYQVQVLCETDGVENIFVTPNTTYTIVDKGGPFEKLVAKKKETTALSSVYTFRTIQKFADNEMKDWSREFTGGGEDRYVYATKEDKMFCFILHASYPQEIKDGKRTAFMKDFAMLLVSVEPYDDENILK